ncbi:ras-associating and dilute domain-containing protein-like [Betta splendens]|uniref:Ras-associating and dilute domain-containing protein-like n=1 Tax=Betta splendens TaxID=158456 RepID=A0A6P7L980_BETSP|nr:ras-associating and dilute domain-containing protein-like [Betta splendens]
MSQMKFPSDELRSLPPRPVSTRRRFVKLGRKISDGSQQSASSTGSSSTGRSAEAVAIRQPSKSRIHRHANRLSGVFRGPASASTSGSMALTASIRSSLSIQSRKSSMIAADALIADDPSELSNQITAPGILKIFGNEICEGAHYKSVLATTHSCAKELVKEALERYGLNKKEAESYVLCDTIGAVGGHQWRTEGFRVVGDNEKPLLLQALWKPRDGMARRFEIQRRSLAEEKTSRDKDTVTAGINAQARKLQKSRSRVTSTLIERTMGRGHRLWRSRSEMDLLDSESENKPEPDADNCVKSRSESLNPTALQSCERPKINPQQNHIHSPPGPPEGDGGSRAETEALCPAGPKDEGEGEESEREETESSDDNTTQYSIHPPHDCPYLLLLQGCSPTQDFVIYLLAAPSVSIGRPGHGEDASKPDILLFADDVLPRHCRLHRGGSGGATALCPEREAAVTRNGETLQAETPLSPGDVIGLGRRYLFLFKDPLTPKEVSSAAPELRIPGHAAAAATSSAAAMSHRVDPRAPMLLRSPQGRSLTLSYEAGDEERIVEEVVAMGSGSGEERPPLTPAFLLCACLQHSSTSLHTSDLRRLLLLTARGVQSAVWECTKDLAAAQPEALDVDGPNPEGLPPFSLQEAVPGLRPLVVWMSNSLELLHFIQQQLPLFLEWRTRKEQGHEDESEEIQKLAMKELHLSCVSSASEETMAVLEEVVLLAFQQCVYYITKILYPVLPGLLDCNPFRQSADPRVAGEVRAIVSVLADTWSLLSDAQLHPDIASQLVGYLFYFINASVFNSLMERGSEPGFYQWSMGVRMRANLDLLLDWAHATGLGELASEHTQKLSSAINLLATPRKSLLQTSWASLRSDYSALNPAQLNHLLSLYSPACPQNLSWAPSGGDRAAALQPADVLENFDTHHPLVLPDGGHQFQLARPVRVPGVSEQLEQLKAFVASLSRPHFNDVSAGKHQSGSDLKDSKSEPPEILRDPPPPSATSAASPPSPPSPPSPLYLDEFSSCVAVLLSQKLKNLEVQSREVNRSALDPSCLLTPPTTPHVADPGDQAKAEPEEAHDEGGLVFECLAALRVDPLKAGCPSMKRIVELKEEDDKQEEDEEECYDEVFSLELERGDRGLGLALVDTKDTSLTFKGVFIRAVLPDSPAARCEKLEPGDRILAVNGVSLLGLDYHSGRELIQSSGDRLRLLVARADWMAKAVHSEC